MEDGAATGFVQRGARGAGDELSVVEMGGRASARKKAASRRLPSVASGTPIAGSWASADLGGEDLACDVNLEQQFRVQDLNARYVDAIDDDRLEAWPDFFRENVPLPDHDGGERRAGPADRPDVRDLARHAARPHQGAATSQHLRGATLPACARRLN